MQKVLLSALLAGFCVTPVMAAQVEVYGLVDIGIQASKMGNDDSTFSMESGQRSGSRVGFKGFEKISDSLEVGFVLENGFDADTGTFADEDRFFNRNSYLYLKTDYGTFKFGRTGALVGGCNGGIFAVSASPFGITWGLAGANKTMQGLTSRVDNSITYNTPKMAGFTFYGQFSNGTDGDDYTDENKAERYIAVGARYNVGNLDVRVVADRTLANGRFESEDQVTAGITANYKFDFARVYAVYQYADNVERFSSGVPYRPRNLNHSHAFLLSANIPVGGIDLLPQVGYVVADGENDKEYDRLGLTMGASYDLSKNIDLYAAATYVRCGKDLKDHEEGDDGWEVISGIRYSF